MDKKQFINELVDALAGEVPSQVITENVSYYRTYLEEEASKTNRSEREVIEEWGSPRLIARSIIDAYVAQNGPYDGQVEDTTQTINEEGIEPGGSSYPIRNSNGCGIMALVVVIIAFLAILTVMRIILSVPGLIILVVLAIFCWVYFSGRRS